MSSSELSVQSRIKEVLEPEVWERLVGALGAVVSSQMVSFRVYPLSQVMTQELLILPLDTELVEQT